MSEYYEDPECRIHPTVEGSRQIEKVAEKVALDSYDKALATIETQQSQIKGLVEALEEAIQAIENLRSLTFDSLGHWELRQNSVPGAQSTQALKLSEKALSTLPADFLEKERKREAVIRAAKEYIAATKIAIINDEEDRFEDLHEAVDALD